MPVQKVRPSAKRPRPIELAEEDVAPVRSGSIKIKRTSAFLGGVMLMLAILGIFWWLGVQRSDTSHFAFPGFASTPTAAVSQVSVLLAEGITLGAPASSATLNQQQAILVAHQLEQDAATKAKSVTASYVTVSYTPTLATAARLNNVAAWMIWYQRIPYVPADASVDPTPFPHSYHDLYVFIDATTGKELLAVWS